MHIGMAVTSNDWQKLGVATFGSVQVADQAPPPDTLCPDSWMCGDVGYSMLPGTQIYHYDDQSQGADQPREADQSRKADWLLQGAGGDIANTADQFHAVWQKLDGDGSVSARVTSVQRVDSYSKAGVMLRESTDPGSPFYAIFATPQNGLEVEYRVHQADNDALNNIPLNTKNYLPIYLKVTRAGNVFNPYYSQDGVNWKVVPRETKTMDMPKTLLAGLTMTSHATLEEGTATFDAVSIGR